MTIKFIDPNKFYREHRLFVHARVINSSSQFTSFSGILTIKTEWDKDFTLEEIVEHVLQEMDDQEIACKNLVIENVSVLSTKDMQG